MEEFEHRSTTGPYVMEEFEHRSTTGPYVMEEFDHRSTTGPYVMEEFEHRSTTGTLCRITFEKSTNLDFPGTTYFSILNISLYECQSWCREKVDCVAVSFSFVVDPLGPLQDTLCTLQNTTTSGSSVSSPQRSVNAYYFTKIQINSEKLCNRLWAFERVPNAFIRGLDSAIFYTSNKNACLAACLNEERFVCRSVEFNYMNSECHLSEYDRRSPTPLVNLLERPGVDYFENNCLRAEEICNTEGRSYDFVNAEFPQSSLAHFVGLYYYKDKELLVNEEEECLQMCTLEKEFICRSILYSPNTHHEHSSCALYHIDHVMFPEGRETYSFRSPVPLMDIGVRSGVYLEAVCNISIQCTDTKMVVFARTNKPFHGRIYALGRSETCRSDVHNSQQFQLDVSLKGQDCNTESANGVFTNTIVLQHHTVVMTKTDKVYKVRCSYETKSKNVSFGMMPVQDPDMTHVTASPIAPLPSIQILQQSGKEATTVRIGDKLTFRIEVPDNTPYGIFARSCMAMAKDGKSVFKMVDDDGCPVDSSIFPGFIQVGRGLESSYEAFRFTESYGVIFQCNVKYCIGKCNSISCGEGREIYQSSGRRKRNLGSGKSSEEMTLSHEIFVLDYGDKITAFPGDSSYVKNTSNNVRESIPVRDCNSKTPVMVLSVISATLLVTYLCTVAYFIAQKRAQKDLP
ncbi:uncharacterized protein LOC106464601 [Limulus polyphemus]|uniref:Uncharacterized protein LOC106464601 n=1 Tax=Limulus polyphemus TaxID=6850 RepID=A0ABM1BE87_LIMPO|nr:uncharacterized protein LOC106464601 [Limulus polyphemus]